MKINGTITALVTPFDESGKEVDFAALGRLIDEQLAAGVEGILVLGTTGETPTISEEEKMEIISFAKQRVGKKAILMVGTGTNSTKKTVENTKKAEELGADVALVVSPYYNKPPQQSLYKHFKEVSGRTDLPIIVYNIKGRTGVNIETPTLKRISELPNIIGVKEASGNISQIDGVISEIKMKREGFSVLSGDDALTFPLMCLGGDGVISVASNLVPAEVKKMVDACLNGKYNEARSLHHSLKHLFKALFIETNPLPVKKALEMKGVCSSRTRPPLYDMQEENVEELKKVVQKWI